MIVKIELNNLGTVNKNEVTIITDKGEFKLFFSYKTIVGIRWNWNQGEAHGYSVIKNYWGPTTGKLLNELEPNKKRRLDSDDFDKKVDEMIKYINL